MLKLLRGVGTGVGLGLSETRTLDGLVVIRPLLRLNKHDLITYGREQGIPYLEDQSNYSDKYNRNYFRNQIGPMLTKLNPKWVDAINRYAEIASEEEQWMAKMALQVFEQNVSRADAGFQLKRHDFVGLPLALQRRLITLILSYLWLGTDRVSFEIIESVRHFIDQPSKGSKQLQLAHGLHVYRQYDDLQFAFAEQALISQQYCYVVEQFPVELVLPLGQCLSFTISDAWDADLERGIYTCYLYLEKLALPLRVRSRQPGDRIALKGMTGHKSLKKWFIDQAIPSGMRDNWPIVCDANDVPIWVPGIAHAQYQVTDPVGNGNKLHIQYGPFIK
jgi:tRNA(Ile)-lysidine synthase